MSEKTVSDSKYQALASAIANQSTVTDLFRMVNSDEFKDAAHGLLADDLGSLRTIYRERMKELDGKVRLQDYAGNNLNVVDVEYWHSSQFDNDGVTLRFHLDDSSRTYKALTSSAPVVRAFSNLDELPSDAHPMRIYLDMKPVRDEKRAAQGQKIFTVKRLPTGTRGDGSDGAPF